MAFYPGHNCRAFRLMLATLEVTNVLLAPYGSTSTATRVIFHIPSLVLEAATLT